MTFWEFADKHPWGLGLLTLVGIFVFGAVAVLGLIAWSERPVIRK